MIGQSPHWPTMAWQQPHANGDADKKNEHGGGHAPPWLNLHALRGVEMASGSVDVLDEIPHAIGEKPNRDRERDAENDACHVGRPRPHTRIVTRLRRSQLPGLGQPEWSLIYLPGVHLRPSPSRVGCGRISARARVLPNRAHHGDCRSGPLASPCPLAPELLLLVRPSRRVTLPRLVRSAGRYAPTPWSERCHSVATRRAAASARPLHEETRQ